MVSTMKRLEDYLMEMADRPESTMDLDISQQLQQKEKDLILAAELGKALLDKNEELSLQNERITEDYTQKLEASSSFHFFCSISLFIGQSQPKCFPQLPDSSLFVSESSSRGKRRIN